MVGIEQPVEPGQFVGDIWYGHPEHRTMGTHRWTGGQWEAMASEEEVLISLLAQARQRAEYWKAEHIAANAEITRLRADLANAGAVMVEAHIGRAASTSREVFADSCNHTMQAIDYMEQLLLSALSTLSPITAAAQVLQVNTPNPVFDLLKPVLMGEVSEAVTYLDADGNEYSDRRMVSWDAMKDVLRLAFRAIAEQEKADG